MKIDKKYFRHFLMLIYSSLSLGVGCGLLIIAGLGSDSMSTLIEGISLTTKISFSNVNLILNLSILVLAYLSGRKNTGLVSIFYPFFVSVGISVSSKLVSDIDSLIINIILFCIGFMLMVLAIGLNSKCECGKNPYDALCFNLANIFKVKYSVVRTSIDLLMLIVGILLHGTYGIGTIIAAFMMGTVAGKLILILETNKTYRQYMMI